jgi:hypothetical protein
MNNASPASLGHVGSESAGHQEWGFEIGIDHIIPILDSEIRDGVATIQACAVDQDIDTFNSRCNRIVKGIDLIGPSDIAPECVHRSAEGLLQFLSDLFATFLIAADDHDRRSRLSERLSENKTQTARPTGNQCGPSFKLKRIRSLHDPLYRKKDEQDLTPNIRRIIFLAIA